LAKSIEKALRLLELLARSETPLGVTEIARLLGLNKATAYRLLETLTRHGYVVRRLGPPRYEPTLKLWELGSAVLSRRDIVRVAQPVIEQVAEQTGETVFLAVPDGHDAVYVAKIDTEHPLRTFTPIGGRVPLHCGSTGKAILAFRSDAFIEEVARDLVGFTPATITTRDGLWREMLDIRRQGYAINQDEWRPGISGVAAPIRDSSGAVIGSTPAVDGSVVARGSGGRSRPADLTGAGLRRPRHRCARAGARGAQGRGTRRALVGADRVASAAGRRPDISFGKGGAALYRRREGGAASRRTRPVRPRRIPVECVARRC
jgi:DNA-binding IclR family transcriptional regulator